MQNKTPRAAKLKSKANAARLCDVAERAGVHLSTVSRALNPGRGGKVSTEVAERVRRIAKEMGYQANAFGYGLKTQRSMTIGIIVPDLTNPLFPPIIRAIEHRLQDEGYIAILGDSDNDTLQEQKIVEKMMSRRIEGLILATAHLNDDFVFRIIDGTFPVVLVNRTTEVEGVVSIAPDDMRGVRFAVDHLVDLGHQIIAHIAGPQSLSTGRNRREGFCRAMRARAIPVQRNLIKECEAYSETAGRAAMSMILDSGIQVTGVVTANDLLALGCYQTLTDRRLRCPQDISITGFNDMPFSDKFTPPLTTVHIDLHQMGDRAAEMLLSIIRNPQTGLRAVELRPSLVVRASTAPPRATGTRP